MAAGIARREVMVSAAAAALAGVAGRSTGARAQQKPIRLGLITPLSGPQEIVGRDHLAGATIAVNQINQAGGVLGRTLELETRDDKASPAAGVAASKDLVSSGVNLLFGVLSSGVALAIAPTLKGDDAVLILCAASANELTHEQFTPNLFRASDEAYMRQRALAKVVAKDYAAINSWTAINPQTAIGASNWDSFVDGLNQFYPQEAGHNVEVIDALTVKYGATDYKNEIAQLMRRSAEGLYLGVYGGDAVTMLRQAAPYGLARKFKVLVDPGSEYIVAQTLGKSTPVGLWAGIHWYFGAYRGNAINDALYDAYVKSTGNPFPAGYVGEGHAGVLAYAAAIQRAGSTETGAVIGALEGMSFASCKGKRTFRKEDHQAICDVNMVQFAPDDTAAGWKIVGYRVVDGAESIEPPSPGKALVLNTKRQ